MTLNKTIILSIFLLFSSSFSLADGLQDDFSEPLHSTANLSYKVAGKRYTPQKTAKNFTQTGKASWYGAKFHGRRTASGEKFDMHALTAAHPTLPIPSYAKVTNVKNGKSVIVRINDRGPFHSKRVLDVSHAAAKKLGFVSQGSATVHIQALGSNKAQAIKMAEELEKLDQAIQQTAI